MNFNPITLKKFGELADSHKILIIEGRNGIGQKFKTAGCIMPDKNSFGEHIYIQDYGFALFQGQYDDKGNKIFCAFFIDPNHKYAFEDCLFIEKITTSNKAIVYQNPDSMKLSAYIHYNKIMQSQDVDHTPTKMESYLLQHIGKPITYKNSNGTLKKLDSKDGSTYAIITNGSKDIVAKLNPFEIKADYTARGNLLAYMKEDESEQ